MNQYLSTKMSGLSTQLKQKDDLLIHPLRYPQPPSSYPYNNYQSETAHSPSSPPPAESTSKISSILLMIIIIVTAIFFISGLLHLLFRCVIRRPPSRSIFQSNRFSETSGNQSIQRQLQQLFRLHDSGLEQSSIDALPVFYYKDIIGLKEPFDCAICLSEFLYQDKLRLLPVCSHAFHIHCIDTWLLSNSTCPLCRCSLSNSEHPMQIPAMNVSYSRELLSMGHDHEENEMICCQSSVTMEECSGEKRVFSVKLGKFRSLNVVSESASLNLDARRCYSMGSYQYIVADSCLEITLSNGNADSCSDMKLVKMREEAGNSTKSGEMEGKKIISRTRKESISFSKIWLWSKKSTFQDHLDSRSSLF